jgi:hypothetical protein
MSVVYRVNDTFDVKIGDVTFSISPLNYKVKADMQSYVIAGKVMDAAVTALKSSVKKVSGLKLPDGSEYELSFNDNGTLKDECIDDLLNLPEASKLNVIAIGLVNGMPEGEFLDPQSGLPLEGVKFIKKATSKKK